MINIAVDQKTGQIKIQHLMIFPTTHFSEFEVKLKDNFRVISGGNDIGQYGLICPVTIFDEVYRMYLNFEGGCLQRC